MIRASDLSNAALWNAPIAPAGTRPAARDAASWFDEGAAARITGDLNPAARGLSVAQHASLVLAHLRGEG